LKASEKNKICDRERKKHLLKDKDMKKISLLFLALGCSFTLISCDKKENLFDNPIGCGCSQMADCEADCACGCQD